MKLPTTILALLIAAPALAADPSVGSAPDRSVEAFFLRYDGNRDGVVSWDEAQRDPELANVFNDADRNGDASLSRSEFQDAAVLAVAVRRAESRGG